MDDITFQPRMDSIYRILIISLLNDTPRSGYDLIKSLEGILGNKPSHGKVYPFLSELQKYNFICEDEQTCVLRSKVVYKLTSDGRKLFLNTVSYLEHIFFNFLASCSHCGVKFYSTNPDLLTKSDNYCCIHCKTVKVIKYGLYEF